MTLQPEIVDELMRVAIDRASVPRSGLLSTYRLQFHAGFTFKDAVAIIPYLSELGVTHVYASPYLKAKAGSTHGYDVIDHCRLNPELGVASDYEAFLTALSHRNMGHILDVVPNHVGIATNENIWWNDVLENGPASVYAQYFDIDWEGSGQTDLRGRVLMATLAGAYGEELEQGNLRLLFEHGSFFITYHDRRFPISPRNYPDIFNVDAALLKVDHADQDEFRSIIDACKRLPDRCQGSDVAAERHKATDSIKHRLAALAGDNKPFKQFIAQIVKAYNGIPGAPQSFDRLDDLLRHQCFRLASWKTAPDEINYRRFFDVNDLAALAMERPEVFTATHRFVLERLAKFEVAGLRIDHPDGLYDPKAYFDSLQIYGILAVARERMLDFPELRTVPWEDIEPTLLKTLKHWISTARWDAAGPPIYVVGEKILAADESVPRAWAVHGTSGYDFLNMTNGLFVDSGSSAAFDELYREWTGTNASYDDLVYAGKKLILQTSLASELNMLAGQLKQIAQQSRYGIDFSLRALHSTLQEVIACFPVYRSYIDHEGASTADMSYIEQAIAAAASRNPRIEPSLLKFLRDTLLVEKAVQMDGGLAARRHFAGKFQQLTSPVMAKGVEDTVFYIFNRLLSLNEVGGSPARFGVLPGELHAFYRQRQQDWPWTMSTLSTHDTKRSEDVRARLNVLSELPQEWKSWLQHWGNLNARHRTMIRGRPAPGRNDEYALYQTLLGAWPLDSNELGSFVPRVKACMLKSMREAKSVTSWTHPDLEQETAMERFIDAILEESQSGEFLADFRKVHGLISHHGAINSLSQTLLKLTAPGVPDIYQGNESWDFSLVDPDNRRPVDFAELTRRQNSQTEHAKEGLPVDSHELTQFPGNVDMKIRIHEIALKLRKQYPHLFSVGDYLPLSTAGGSAANLFAFARSHESVVAVTAVPRLSLGLRGTAKSPHDTGAWGDTYLELPGIGRHRGFRNALTDSPIRLTGDGDRAVCLAADLFADFPVALLILE